MVDKKSRGRQKTLFFRSYSSSGCDRKTLAVKMAWILLLCLGSFLYSACVTEKDFVKREPGLADTKDKLKDRNEEINETKLRMIHLEESCKRLNKKLLTLQTEYNGLQEKYFELSKNMEEMELDFADVDLQVFNRLRELKTQMGKNDTDISRKVKELQAQLERFKEVPDGPRLNEVTYLKEQIEKIENRIKAIQIKLSGTAKKEDKSRQKSQYEAIIDVINKFDKYYGGPHMDEITDLTTARFRENRPGAVWVSEIWQVLDNLGYKRLSSVVTETKIVENRALVVLESEIQTKKGKKQQTEIFYLIQKGGWWLIDELVVGDDDKIDLSPMRR
jgi:hypothetical protein